MNSLFVWVFVRSDDGGPVEAMVMKQAQELSLLKAQLAVTKAQLETKGTCLSLIHI